MAQNLLKKQILATHPSDPEVKLKKQNPWAIKKKKSKTMQKMSNPSHTLPWDSNKKPKEQRAILLSIRSFNSSTNKVEKL